MLVADDSPSTRRILTDMLERAGAVACAIADGSEVLEQLRAPGPGFDAVVLDVGMNRMGGVEAARALAPALPSLPRPVATLFLSVDFPEDLQATAARLGAHPEPIRKPLEEREVLRVLAAALGRTPPEAGTDRAPPVLPSVPGCDLGGALDRCDGDRALLLDLQSQVVTDAYRRGEIFAQSIRSRSYPLALGELHRLRGDLLNLGFTEAAARMAGIEARTRELAQRAARPSDATVPSVVITGGDGLVVDMREALDALGGTAAALRQLPALARAPARAPLGGGLEETRFSALKVALENGELGGFRALVLGARLLPPRYAAEVDAEFRAHLRRLDFQAALRLLDESDRIREPRATGSGFRILVVDDMPSAVLLLHGMIEHLGQVRFALSAEQALEVTAAWAPDLVISDVHLGGMSGIDFCRRLKAMPQGAETTVLLVSADGDVAVEVEGLTAGATDFLSKPLNPARVVGRINAHLSVLRRQSAFAVSIAHGASSAVLGFITCSYAGRVIDLSPRIERVVGAEGLWKGRALQDLFAASSFSAVLRSLAEITRGGRTTPFDATINAEGGAMIPVRIAGWSAPGTTGRIAWFSVEDRRDRLASERRRFEDELARSVGTLAGGMAHEYNNLLTVAIGNVDLALELAADPAQRERLHRASGALLRAADISRRLSDFGLRGGGAGTGKAPMVQSLEAVLDPLWPLLTQGIPPGVVVVRERSDEQVLVCIDARGLRTALTNLLLNAYDSMPKGGQVIVRERVAPDPEDGHRVALIEVIDTGQGMAPETLQRAFEPFFTTGSPKHTGLGLTEVRGFMQRQGGTVWIDSAPGRGTTVRLAFPPAPPPPSPGTPGP